MIVAWFNIGVQIKKKRTMSQPMTEAPSERELAPQATEGECVKLCYKIFDVKRRKLSRAPSVFCLAKSTSLPEGG